MFFILSSQILQLVQAAPQGAAPAKDDGPGGVLGGVCEATSNLVLALGGCVKF